MSYSKIDVLYMFMYIRYSGERVAHLACSTNLQMKNEAVVVGTKGIIKVPNPFWCPTKLEAPSVSKNLSYYVIIQHLGTKLLNRELNRLYCVV